MGRATQQVRQLPRARLSPQFFRQRPWFPEDFPTSPDDDLSCPPYSECDNDTECRESIMPQVTYYDVVRECAVVGAAGEHAFYRLTYRRKYIPTRNIWSDTLVDSQRLV